MMYYYGYGPEWGMMGGFGWLLGVLWWVFIICCIVLVFRWAFGSRRGRRRWRHWEDGDAVDILKERYAKGEIDKTEFEQKKKDLES